MISVHQLTHISILDFSDVELSVQNFLSFRLISKNLKIKIYKTVILPVVLYG